MRISLSLKLEENTAFGEYILSLRDSKSLMPLLSSLLKIYYEDEHLQAEINKVMHRTSLPSGDMSRVHQQMANIQQALNQTNMGTSMLTTHIEGAKDVFSVGNAGGVFASPTAPSEQVGLPVPVEYVNRLNNVESSLEKVTNDLNQVLELLKNGVTPVSTVSREEAYSEAGTASEPVTDSFVESISEEVALKPVHDVTSNIELEKVTAGSAVEVESQGKPENSSFELDIDEDTTAPEPISGGFVLDTFDAEEDVFVPKKLSIDKKPFIVEDDEGDEEKSDTTNSKKPASFNKMFGSLKKK